MISWPGVGSCYFLHSQFTDTNVAEVPVARRLISLVLAQLYDPMGFFSSPIVIGVKIFLLRSCKLAGPTELDFDLRL